MLNYIVVNRNINIMEPKLRSARKRFPMSYSSGSIPTLNTIEFDSGAKMTGFFKPIEFSKILELDHKQFKGKLPPIVNDSCMVKRTDDRRVLRKHQSKPKIRPSGTKLIGKIDSSSFTESASNIIKRVGLPKIKIELEESNSSDSGRRYQSLTVEAEYTPTFRNISCESEFLNEVKSRNFKIKGKSESNYSLIEQKPMNSASQKGLIKMNSHFIHSIKNIGMVLKEPARVYKKVKKIKVLEHKFPRDMFC